MKRIMSALLLIGGLIVAGAPAAHATTSQAKAEICHNGHSIEVSLNAVASQDTGHGILVLANVDFEGNSWDADFVSFTAHVGPGGHANDSVLRVFKKTGNNEDNLFVLADACAGPEGPTGPQGPAGPAGPKGEPGDPGHSPELTILCFPGVGLGVLVDYDGESQLPDGAHILAEGEVCPLAGEDGTDGVDGVDGIDGTNGLNGVDGVAGPSGPAGLAGPAGPAGATTVTEAPTTTTTAPAAPAAPTGDLPRTGGNIGLAFAALALIVAGGAFRLFGMRRTA